MSFVRFSPRDLAAPLRAMLLCVWCFAGGAMGADALPPLQGSWEVIQVAVDHRDQPHWAYFPDDPRLLGRTLNIGATGIALDDGARACGQPLLSRLAAGRLQAFIGQRFPRPAQFATPTAPTLHDFGLDLADTRIVPIQIACTPAASPWNGAWLVPLPAGRLLTNADNSGYVLVLRRRESGDAIRASFACTRARTAAELAICASPQLAGYDRSVAAAYRRAAGLAGDAAAALRQQQGDWLKHRNACGADAGCLIRSMRARVDQLMQP